MAHIIPGSAVSNDRQVPVIIQGPGPFTYDTVPVKILVFHVSRAPAAVYFRLVGHFFIFGLDDSTGFIAPYFTYFLALIPGIDQAVFVSEFQNLRLTIAYIKLGMVRKISGNLVFPA